MLSYPESNAPWIEQAQWVVQYYSTEKHFAWALGLLLAQEWLHLIKQPQPNIYEVQMFSRVLESEKEHQGSGWHDFAYRVRNWVAEIEAKT